MDSQPAKRSTFTPRRLLLCGSVCVLVAAAIAVTVWQTQKSGTSNIRGSTTGTDKTPISPANNSTDSGAALIVVNSADNVSPGYNPSIPAVSAADPTCTSGQFVTGSSGALSYWFGSDCCDYCPSSTILSVTCDSTSATYQMVCSNDRTLSASESITAAATTDANGGVYASPQCPTDKVTQTATCTRPIAIVVAPPPTPTPTVISDGGTDNETPTASPTQPPAHIDVPEIIYPGVQPAFGRSRELLWSDEFDGTQLNRDIWSPTVGDGCPSNCGYGNSELQSYEDANCFLDGRGNLVLEARSENPPIQRSGSPVPKYVSSGKVSTRTYANHIMYGRVEVRATLPRGQGAWPSIFFLPVELTYSDWPGSGEIDLMETFNTPWGNAQRIMGSLHSGWPRYNVGNREGEGAKGQNACVMISGDSWAGSPHIFTLEWAPQFIKYYMDDMLYCELTSWFAGNAPDSPTAPFDKPFTMMINLAYGGVLPSLLDPSQIPAGTLPIRMEIDYVRVFKLSDEEMNWTRPAPGAPQPVLAPSANEPRVCKWGNTPDDAWQLNSQVRLDAEQFDCGGPGVAYGDNDPLVNTGDGVLRRTEGVEVYEDPIWIPLSSGKFADCSGDYVSYEPLEWTRYSIYIQQNANNMWIEMRHNTLQAGGTRFKILLDSTDCTTTDPQYMILDQTAKQSRPPASTPPAYLNIHMRCWQIERWPLSIQYYGSLQGLHKLTFCSMGEMAMTYFEVMTFQPTWTMNEGPGCN